MCMLLLPWALIWGAVWLSCCWLSMRGTGVVCNIGCRSGVTANAAGLICYSVLLSDVAVMDFKPLVVFSYRGTGVVCNIGCRSGVTANAAGLICAAAESVGWVENIVITGFATTAAS
ncbi:hypothetical protein LOK49_LG06G03350 [Camellia lanceoleosa]|uniref:Uncharacterized protein n=1 Tax=Camellia lanceoleosa TaxID=1840588 RepID=A0ACC0HC26_9ERIC|nr:hypothetical protein LOK49_LG06G03350 [Camellia lanceoleosa]